MRCPNQPLHPEAIPMDNRTITQEAFFNALPAEVFEAFLDSKQHSAFTGAPAEIDRKPGGRFIAYDGALTGTIVETVKDHKIVQDWHSQKWPTGHLSRLTLTLTPTFESRGTQLSLLQTSVPADFADQINTGWRDYYWSKLGPYLRARKVAPVRRFLEEFKNRANIDVVDETWTADCVLHVPGMSIPPGREGQKSVGRAIFAAFGNLHVDVTDTIVEGDRVVERHTVNAVHKGEFMGLLATGKKVSWTENHIYRIVGDKIAETWSEVSFHDLLAQISSRAISA
jgi:predicted ester cyclase/uncharacterized protein YndB with AHSA1/START domain